MKVHYLELRIRMIWKRRLQRSKSRPRCGLWFVCADELGNARTAELPDGSIVGVREPMRDDEEPMYVSPYFLTDR